MDILKWVFGKPDNTSIYYYETISDWWDFEGTPITSAVWVAGSAILFVVTSILLIFRRNFQPLKSRSPLLLWVTMTGELIIVAWACMRMVVGRSNFPCVFYVTFYCLMPPLVFAPIVLRCWRLVFVSRLASTKTLLAVQATGNEYDSVKRRFAFFKIVISTPFLLVLSLVIVLLHFAVVGALLVVETGKLSFSGCFAGMIFMAGAAMITVFWGILALVSAILTRIFVREPWGVARGIGITVMVIIPATLFWFSLNMVPVYDYLIERYFPSGYFLFAALVFDVSINSLFTVVLTWTHRAKLNKMQSEIEEYKKGLLDVLKDPESRKFLKDFAVKSFAPETVAFWEAVDHFRQVTMVKDTEEERKATARRIVSDFIDPNGPLALNLTHASEWKTTVTFAIDDPAGYYKVTQQKLKQKAAADGLEPEKLETEMPAGNVQLQQLALQPQQPQFPDLPDVALSQSLDASISVVMGIHNVRDENIGFTLESHTDAPFPSTTQSSEPGEGTMYTEMGGDSASSQQGDESQQKELMTRSPSKRMEDEDITKLRVDIFDELQRWVERDMAQDLYARFKESKHWSDMNTSISLRREMLKSGGII